MKLINFHWTVTTKSYTYIVSLSHQQWFFLHTITKELLILHKRLPRMVNITHSKWIINWTYIRKCEQICFHISLIYTIIYLCGAFNKYLILFSNQTVCSRTDSDMVVKFCETSKNYCMLNNAEIALLADIFGWHHTITYKLL